MQITKKKLVGLTGLVAVGALTAVAYSLPQHDASAVDAGGVDLEVTVESAVSRVNWLSPKNGDEFTKPNIPIKLAYTRVKKMEFYLSYKDDTGTTVRKKIREFSPTDESGTIEFSEDISSYGRRDYTLSVAAINYDGVAIPEDSVSFKYNAISSTVDPDGTVPGKDPVISIEVDDDVEKVEVGVYDKDGKPIFVDKDGKEIPIIVGRDDIDPETGKITVELPFDKYGIKDGEYTVVIKAFDKDDAVISIVTNEISYTDSSATDVPAKPTPETPNTGSTFFDNLNIASADYIITGLIFFAGIVGFAMYLIFRKSRR